MDVYTFSGVKKGWQREMGKEERIWWEMWVMEQEKGCRGGVLGLTDGEKCDDGGRRRGYDDTGMR